MALLAGGIVDRKARRAGQPFRDALNEAHEGDWQGTRRRPRDGQINGPGAGGPGIVWSKSQRRDQGTVEAEGCGFNEDCPVAVENRRAKRSRRGHRPRTVESKRKRGVWAIEISVHKKTSGRRNASFPPPTFLLRGRDGGWEGRREQRRRLWCTTRSTEARWRT